MSMNSILNGRLSLTILSASAPDPIVFTRFSCFLEYSKVWIVQSVYACPVTSLNHLLHCNIACDWVIAWSIDLFIVWLIDCLIYSLIDWLIDWLFWLIDWSIGCLINIILQGSVRVLKKLARRKPSVHCSTGAVSRPVSRFDLLVAFQSNEEELQALLRKCNKSLLTPRYICVCVGVCVRVCMCACVCEPSCIPIFHLLIYLSSIS